MSYSQTALSSFEENAQDSSLTIFYRLSHYENYTDTIYPNKTFEKLTIAFEDIDSINVPFDVVITLARGRRPIISNTYSTTKKINFPTSNIRYGDRLIIFSKFKKNGVLDSLANQIYIIPKPLLDDEKRLEYRRLRDSTLVARNHVLAMKYYQSHFEKLKEPQENLTEKDKKKINKIYSRLKLPYGKKKKIGNYKLIDKTEIRNIHWVEYLSILFKDSLAVQHYDAFPNTMIWDKFNQNGVIDEYYLRNPTLKYFPVVGVTYQQAQQYCIWRANMENHILRKRNIDKDYEVIVHYRLPTEEEWEYAAKKYNLNKKSKENVAEMTSEKGIAKGGSFAHTLEECAADRVQIYDSPQAWLGFRCVAEVVVRKKDKE
ncbi:MAG: hypothetical protein COZ18_01160 [Flexibacter sp. CG_4_10_14_3_um_filter_32_15]|nr:MAG: hypothetical protein COZ18_01160 [Flexibacter sp. CG_4_10_14_3_um_filter_32_15]